MKKRIELVAFLILLFIFFYVLHIKLAPYYYNRGIIYYDRSLFDEALIYFNKSLNINPNSDIAHYMLANTFTAKNKPDSAIKEYKEAIKINSNFIQARLALAQIYRNDCKYEDALTQLQQAATLEENKQEIKTLVDEIYFDYSVHCLKKGVDLFIEQDKQQAFDLLNKAIRLKPDFMYPHYVLALFYFTENDYDTAQEQLLEALRLSDKFWPAHKLLGDIYFQKNLFEEAISKYKSALRLYDNDASMHNDLGLALIQLEHYEEASGYLEKALELEPNNLNIRYSLASVYRDMGTLDRAITEYEKIIRLYPDFPHVYIDLADIYINKSEEEKALKMYKKEIELSQIKLLSDPDNPIVLNNLAYALNGSGEHRKAKELIERALSIKPDYREGYITLSKIYEKIGKHEEAIEALKKSKLSSAKVNFIDRDIDRLKEAINFKTGAYLQTDSIYLKNGRVIKGRIKEEDDEKVVLEIHIGDTSGYLTFYRDAIERISKGE